MPDPIAVANEKSSEEFINEYGPDGTEWQRWTHPETQCMYTISLQSSSELAQRDFSSCFNLIEATSDCDYKASKMGWNPRAKKTEMKLLDLKYFLVKTRIDEDEKSGGVDVCWGGKGSGEVKAFASLMPTYEDGFKTLYCYEIHLDDGLQGTGLGTILMESLDVVAKKIPGMEKIMLTCFTRNQRAVKFYEKLGFKRYYTPPPRALRSGKTSEPEYVIFSKDVVG